jgi:hypothetical protein
MTEQVEIPHKIKDFDAIAHDTMIRRMAAQVIQSNKSSAETVQKHVSQAKEKLKAYKQVNSKKTIQRKKKFSVLTAMIQRSTGDSHA